MQAYLRRILTARIYDVAVESPLDAMPRLAVRTGRRCLLKREDAQPVFSFKLRGATNKIAQLPPEALAKGVLCASAGNHAQGVALAAKRRGARAVVVMPATTPSIKVDAVRALGGEVVLHGDSFDEAFAHAKTVEARDGLTFIHPYDDPDVIAGQGTLAMELLRQHPDPIEAVFVPVGGGGLIAGVSAYFKALAPQVRIIGVEPEDAASMHAALGAKSRVRLDHVGLFADGVAVRQVGEEPFRIASRCVDGVILVNTDEICAAIKDIFDDTRCVAEPAGALAVAGLKKYAASHGASAASLIAVLSGANMNFDRLRHVAERAELGEEREALFAVTIPEAPGSFRAFCEAIGRRNITEFNYRYADAGKAHVFAGVELRRGASERLEVAQELRARGYEVLDLSGDETAKLHLRHLVGGRAGGLADERLFRFQFPERPGALLEFLSRMATGWNISLFHYRNHGADHGRVLAGIQVAPAERGSFDEALRALGYDFWEETGNPAYRMFLS